MFDIAAARLISPSSSVAVCGTPASLPSRRSFTNDRAVGLRTPSGCDKLKLKCGCALSSLVEYDRSGVASSSDSSALMSRRELSEILQPRAEEIFIRCGDEIRERGTKIITPASWTAEALFSRGCPRSRPDIRSADIAPACRRGLPGDHVSNRVRDGGGAGVVRAA